MSWGVDTPAMMADLRALLDDGLDHTRAELRAIAHSYGGNDRHWRHAISVMKRNGYYVAYRQGTDRYYHAIRADDIQRANTEAANWRAIRETTNRLLAARGELIRLTAQGRGTAKALNNIAAWEGVISSLAIAVHQPPSALLRRTMLTHTEEAAIRAEFATGTTP